MADYKFTSEELKRCIECCIKAETWGDCKEMGCPALSKQGCRFYLRTDDDYENTIYIEILKDVLELLNHKKSEWISVEERLPEECGMPVLMVAVNRYSQTRVVKGFTDYQCPITFHTNEREYDGVWRAWDITHWMPLPEAPKGKDGEGE